MAPPSKRWRRRLPANRRQALPAPQWVSVAAWLGQYLPKINIAEASAAVRPRHRTAHSLGSPARGSFNPRAASRGSTRGSHSRSPLEAAPSHREGATTRGAFSVTPTSPGLVGNVVFVRVFAELTTASRGAEDYKSQGRSLPSWQVPRRPRGSFPRIWLPALSLWSPAPASDPPTDLAYLALAGRGETKGQWPPDVGISSVPLSHLLFGLGQLPPLRPSSKIHLSGVV